MSVGVTPTRTLAKVPNRTAKKDPASDAVCILLTRAAQEKGARPAGADRPVGVAGRMAERPKAIGIATRLQLRDADAQAERRSTSFVMERMVLELRGLPCPDLERNSPDRKSIMATRSLGRPVAQRREMEEAVASHTARAAEKMFRQALATAGLIVFALTNRLRPDQRR